MQYTIKGKGSDVVFVVDDTAEREDVAYDAPHFFSGNHEEEITIHRGCVISYAHDTAAHKPVWRTSAWLFGSYSDSPTKQTTRCVSSGCKLQSVADAIELIDTILDGGYYEYGMKF